MAFLVPLPVCCVYNAVTDGNRRKVSTVQRVSPTRGARTVKVVGDVEVSQSALSRIAARDVVVVACGPPALVANVKALCIHRGIDALSEEFNF